MRERWLTSRWLAPCVTVAVALVLWEVAAAWGPVSPRLFPGPVQVADAAKGYPVSQLLGDISISLARLVVGFAVAAVAGVLLGGATGASRVAQRVLHAPLELLRPIPPLAWIAVAVIWFGLGETSKVFIIFVAAFFPIYLGAFRGVRSVDRSLVEAGQTLGVRGHQVATHILLRAAAPDIAIGLRVGWGLAFTALVGAEVIAADSGLGYLVMNARALGDVSLIVYGVILIGLLGWATDSLISLVLMKKFLAWHFERG